MGGWLSYLWPARSAELDPSPKLDQVDSTTGLSLRQKLVVKENWDVVRSNIVPNGIDFFVEFFRAHPEYLKHFKGFEKLNEDEMRKSKKMAAHATNVMYAISSLVDNLNDVECLLELLMKTGENHIRRKVTVTHFNNLAVVFVAFLQSKLGTTFTPFARKAWEETFKVMNSVIHKGLQGGNE